MAIFRVIFEFRFFNLLRLSPKNNLKRFLGYVALVLLEELKIPERQVGQK